MADVPKKVNGHPVAFGEVDRLLIGPFERDTADLQKHVDTLPPDGLLRKLLLQELDLRRRRAEQWRKNPSGVPKHPLRQVKGYSKV